MIRTYTQFVVDTYEVESQVCNKILKKAVLEDIPSVKSAYFMTVMKEDQRAFFETLKKYHIGFLASNITYASEEEIAQNACRMPDFVSSGLEWTGGTLMLAAAWTAYSVSMWLSTKCTSKAVAPAQEEAEVDEPLDKPPIVPRQARTTEHMKYIRAQKKEKPKESIAGKIIKNMSPRLRQRMMSSDV